MECFFWFLECSIALGGGLIDRMSMFCWFVRWVVVLFLLVGSVGSLVVMIFQLFCCIVVWVLVCLSFSEFVL